MPFSSSYGFSERGLSATAQSWYTRVLANGGTVSNQTLRAVDEFIRGVNGGGTNSVSTLLSRIVLCNLCCGTNSAAALTPLIRGTGNALWTISGGVTYQERGPGSGFTGNGTTGYVQTGFLESALPARNVISVHPTAPYTLTATSRALYGGAGAPPYSRFSLDATTIYASNLLNGSLTYNPGATLAPSHWSNCNDINGHRIFQDSTQRASSGPVGQAGGAQQIVLLAQNLGGAVSEFYNNSVGAFCILDLTTTTLDGPTDTGTLVTALRTFAMKLGRPTA